MTNLPSRAMEPEATELSRTTFACPSWWLSNIWDEENQQIGQVCCHRWKRTLPGQCSFHCTKPVSSAEKTTVHALLYEDYEELSSTRTIDDDTYATSRAMVTKRVIEVTFQIWMRRSMLVAPSLPNDRPRPTTKCVKSAQRRIAN